MVPGLLGPGRIGVGSRVRQYDRGWGGPLGLRGLAHKGWRRGPCGPAMAAGSEGEWWQGGKARSESKRK